MKKRKIKTKILATIGPATDSIENLTKLIEAGTKGLRVNFSHGDEEYFSHLFKIIDQVRKDKKLPIPILMDLCGPKIRIGKLKEPSYELISGDKIELTIDELLGTADKVSTSYKSLPKDSNIGDIILIDDGLLRLEVIEKKSRSVVCKIINGGTLKPKKGMNLPGMQLSTPAVTEKDLNDLEFATKHRIDFIALSFVRHPDDILGLKNWLLAKGHNIPIIAKIEKQEAVDHFEAILKVSDGIMVARGDLGVELPLQLVPIIQKNLIRRCNTEGKLVITATQMLESMIQNPVPTRAEANDVANAVLDGTDIVMLSGETAVGKHPFKAVEIMNDIIKTAETQTQFKKKIKYEVPTDLTDNLFDATGKGFADIANQINAAAIVVFTNQGRTAKKLSKFRPRAPIVAFSDNFETLNMLNLYPGVTQFYQHDVNDEEKATKNALRILKENQFVEKGDIVVFTSGAPITDLDRRSWIRFVVVD